MAYDTNSLARTGSVPFAAGLSKSQFIYATADNKAAVLAANYFNADYKRFDQGDRITVTANLGGTPSTFSVVVTSAKGATTVVVAADGQQALVDNSGGTTGQPISASVAKSVVQMGLQLADIATGTIKTAMPFAGRVLSVLWRTAKPATTASKLATATLGINGVAATGGVIALTSANCTPMGSSVAGSAVTAGNAFTAGQTIEFTFSAVTAFVEGDGWFEVTIIDDDLNNALASLNAA